MENSQARLKEGVFSSWNVITGCTQISPACENCYAKVLTKKLQGRARKEVSKKIACPECERGSLNDDSRGEIEYFCECDSVMKRFKIPKYYQGWDKVVFHKESLNEILNKKKYPSGSKVIVNSVSDIFHEDISDDDIIELFDYMSKRQDLIFQIITKRTHRMFHFLNWVLPNSKRNIQSNIWFGVAVENQRQLDLRCNGLLHIKQYISKNIKCFVYIEPCLEDIDLSAYIEYLDLVIDNRETNTHTNGGEDECLEIV